MKNLACREEGGIAWITLCRPKVRNALSRVLVDELDKALGTLERARGVKALILCGEGDFAAGADITEMVDATPEEAMAFSFSPVFNRLAAFPLPTIAAIDGYALGGGLELALARDIRIAARTARLGLPEITLGIMPGAGGTARLPKTIGLSRALAMIYTGEILSGEQALALGLVDRLAEDSARAEAEILAAKIAKGSRTALSAAKKAVLSGWREADTDRAAEQEMSRWAALFASYDQKEGMRAFLERRSPVFEDR